MLVHFRLGRTRSGQIRLDQVRRRRVRSGRSCLIRSDLVGLGSGLVRWHWIRSVCVGLGQFVSNQVRSHQVGSGLVKMGLIGLNRVRSDWVVLGSNGSGCFNLILILFISAAPEIVKPSKIEGKKKFLAAPKMLFFTAGS